MAEMMERAIPITTLFLDVGGVLLNNGWDHHARRRVAKHFHLEWAEMEERHRLAFETHEEGKLTFEEYLGRVVFYRKRAFTRAQFRRSMCEQSKAYPEMIELVARLKIRHGLKIAVVSNEAREVNAYRIREFLMLRRRPQARRGHFSAGAGHLPDAGPAGTLHRKHTDVRRRCRGVGDSKRSSHGLQIHVRETSVVGIAGRGG
jgi:phosphoglycolate phosphatase-like HAD superfamily hydrolase